MASDDIPDFIADRFCVGLAYLNNINGPRRGSAMELYVGDTINLDADTVTTVGDINGEVRDYPLPDPLPEQHSPPSDCPLPERAGSRLSCRRDRFAERMRSSGHLRRRMVAIAVAFTLAALALTGCSFLSEPPRELRQAAADLADTTTRLPGIRSAEATIKAVDPKDKPGQWYIELTVEAASPDGIDTIPSELTPLLDEAQQYGPAIHSVLQIPAGPGIAPISLGVTSGGTVRAAKVLRSTPGIQSVDGHAFGSRLYISMDSSTTLTAITPTLRDALRAGGDDVPSVLAAWNEQPTTRQISIEVSPTWPSAGLLTALEAVGKIGSLKSLSATATSDSMPATIHISVSEATDVLEVSDLLLEVPGSSNTSPAHFWVYGPDGDQLEGTI